MISRFSSIDFSVESTETSVRGTMIWRAVRFENWKTPSMISRFSSDRIPAFRSEVFLDRFQRREHGNVRARHHDLACRPLRKLEDALDDLAVLLGQDPGFPIGSFPRSISASRARKRPCAAP